MTIYMNHHMRDDKEDDAKDLVTRSLQPVLPYQMLTMKVL